ncbi:MAG: 50S ribosomal protein L10 [Acutalibacteraceae bacterium]|nr:50S ribosomal protein L10 [Acutalibacteraceae bacterium]
MNRLPSEKVLEQKKKAVAEIVDKLNNSVAGVLVEYSGVSVADDTALRRELREAGVDYSVVKNTLLERAAEQVGLDELKDVLAGTTALAASKEDHAAAARIAKNFAKTHEGFKIKSGYLDGKVIDLDTVNQLADLPTYDVLMSTVCAALNAPIASFARVIQAVVDKKNEEGEEAPAAEAEAPAEEAAPAAEAAPAEEAAPAAEAAPAE